MDILTFTGTLAAGALGKIIADFLYPIIHTAGESFKDKVFRMVAQKLKDISPEKIVAPEPYVVVPVLQALSYSFNEEHLRDLYASLLVKSMTEDTRWEVHPSYIEVIKQMSPFDARFFKNFFAKSRSGDMYDIVISKDDKTTHHFERYMLTEDDPFLLSLTLFSLERLGLIYGHNLYQPVLIPEGKKEERRSQIFASGFPQKLAGRKLTIDDIDVTPLPFGITYYGELFYKTCCE